MRSCAFIDNLCPRLEVMVAALTPISHKRSAKSVIARLVVAASAYFIRQERNNRIFKKRSRKVEQLRDAIIYTVRLMLMSMRFKNSASAMRCLDQWQIPKYTMTNDL